MIDSMIGARHQTGTQLFAGLKNQRRLRAVLTSSTQATRDDAYTIILRHEKGVHLTLWMAVLAVDPDFPRSKPLEDSWPQVPDQFTLARALRYAREAEPKTR